MSVRMQSLAAALANGDPPNAVAIVGKTPQRRWGTPKPTTAARMQLEGGRGDQYKIPDAGDVANAAGVDSRAAPGATNQMGGDGMGGMMGMAAGLMGGGGGGGAGGGGAMGMLGGLLPMLQGGGELKKPASPQEFNERAIQILPADIRMFSGCRDEQTSADVSNTASFGLPPDAGPGGAGGACTNAMMLSLTKNPQPSWIDLLDDMRGILAEKGFTQIPQLSSSREVLLSSTFDLKKDGGRTKALFIGINYVGMQGELRGCHNDVIQMKQFVTRQGFDEGNMQVLMDDGQHQNPTHDNILEGIRWLVSGAQSGDDLFMHYSGHGGNMPDDNGDEEDGMDETMVPMDYQSRGQIRDDKIFEELCAPLPEGVTLTVVMDCCHSGSILDLPYNFACSEGGSQQVHNGGIQSLQQNQNFGWGKAFKVAMSMYQAYQRGGASAAMQAGMTAMR